MNQVFEPDWRTQNRAKRKFYARYMTWIERGGYVVVACVFAAFIFAFNYPVEDMIKADNVAIEGESTVLKSEQEAMVVEVIVEDFAEVQPGQPLVKIIEGAEQIAAYQQSQWIAQLRSAGREIPASLDRAIPVGRVLVAESAGTFILAGENAEIAAGEPIGKVVDYSKLVLNAELEGNTVARADKNQTAKISAINLGSESGSLFRGGSSEGDLVSGSVLPPALKESIEAQLKGEVVKARDDVPLAIDGIKMIQIDSSVKLGASAGSNAPIQADPAVNYALKGSVVEGEHIGTLQIATLPPDLLAKARRQIAESAKSKPFRTADGKSLSIASVENTQFVVQLNVKGAAEAGSTAMPATVISRKFAAKIAITAPPAFLVEAVRAADRRGKPVTARVEVVTSTRPIALILLKKS